jgi:uncharacterized membrane protein YozB (DUF420 family)
MVHDPMIGYLGSPGFLDTRGSLGADASLVIMLAALALITIGVVLAMTKRFAAHRWVQTAAVCLNAIPVVFWMIRFFWLYVRPGLPANFGAGNNALTTVHAVVGLVGVVLGVFVVIRANQLEAKGQSLSEYKLPMTIAYFVYLLGTALGVWVYFAFYG